MNKRLCKDIVKLSTGFQTALESFHAVNNQFTPKLNIVPYYGQLCRQHLAALHYNEIVKVATTKTGKMQYKVVFPMYKMGDHFSVEKVAKNMTFKYVNLLWATVVDICGKQNSMSTSFSPPLTSSKRKPTHAEVPMYYG
ncbi:LOW QUALITY PROTEIN: hypothetical protein MAR_019002 [Mya arenaria]|uniref:Uncharacterized protein n=1 Tax=Mya arenaria TaxID=6604 RepID=A0ABY7EIS4_MYAAR|nr:LOW QUALITY PROTEIN: hypothetical protein MAR_019002 [Mya arenaria]